MQVVNNNKDCIIEEIVAMISFKTNYKQKSIELFLNLIAFILLDAYFVEIYYLVELCKNHGKEKSAIKKINSQFHHKLKWWLVKKYITIKLY